MVDVDAGAASPPALARQQRLAAIVESSEDAIIARTLDGTITEWNGAAERLFGYTAAEAIGQPISILFPFDCIDDPARIDELLQSGRGLERHETVRVRKDGSRVYVSATVSPISDASGALVGAAIIARDITRDRLAEEERAQLFEREQAARAEAERARERLTFIGRASAALVSSLDYAATIQGVARLLVPGFADWCLVDLLEGGRLRRVAAANVDPELEQAQLHLWDERRMDLAGPHPVARVLRSGQPLFDSVVSPTALESFAQDAGHRQVLRQLATSSRIVLPLTARGEVFGTLSLAHTSASNRRYSAEDLALAQELARWASIAIDHARLYASEQEARARAERAALRTARLQAATAAFSRASSPGEVIAALVHEGLAALGAQAGAIALADPAGTTLRMASLVGYAPEVVERYGTRPVEPSTPMAEVARTGRPLWFRNHDEVRARYPATAGICTVAGLAAGAVLPLRIERRTLGSVALAFGHPQDFDADAQAFVEGLVGQCALALERARLYEAEQRARTEAQAAIRARDEFLSIASHELRNPVAALVGHIHLLQRLLTRGRLSDEGLERYLERMRASGARLVALTEDLLDVSRLHSGQLRLRLEPCNLVALVCDVVARYHPATKAGRHRLAADLPAQPLVVRADPDRMDQVLANLLDNAFKYSPDGGEVQVSLKQEAEGVQLEVRDQGIGLPPDRLERIFEPFGRAENAVQRNIPGMGLGLYVCRQIVASHGGHLQATSAGEHQGTTLTLWIPRDCAGLAPAADS